MKFYFISYAVRQLGKVEWFFANSVIKQDPLQWILELKGLRGKEEFVLISYQEISPNQYMQYKDLFG